IRDLGGWRPVEQLSADDQPTLYGTAGSEVEYEPDEMAHEEIGQPLAYIHDLDGRVETVGPGSGRGVEPVHGPADPTLAPGRDFGGGRARVQCGVCEAECPGPRGTDIHKLAISGCRGAGQGHRAHCECPVCDPLEPPRPGRCPALATAQGRRF